MDHRSYEELLIGAEQCYLDLSHVAEDLRALQADQALSIFKYGGKASYHGDESYLREIQSCIECGCHTLSGILKNFHRQSRFIQSHRNAEFVLEGLSRYLQQLVNLDLRLDFDRAIVVIENLTNELHNVIEDYKVFVNALKMEE